MPSPTDEPIVLKAPAIPEHPNYVMFDLEGLPSAARRAGEDLPLGTAGLRRATWAPSVAATAGFGRDGDREGWEAFLREAEAIFAEHGDIPFVHWASYEKTKIDLYLSRYGDRDGIAERVKENLLDLLPITYESVALPSSSYSLKLVEQIAGYERQLDRSGGDWSMARYIEATETDDERLPRLDHGRDPRLQPRGPRGDLGRHAMASLHRGQDAEGLSGLRHLHRSRGRNRRGVLRSGSDHGDDEYFRANLGSMPVLARAMEEAGVFTRVHPELFMFMQGDLVTRDESDFIARSLGTAPPPADVKEAEFVDAFRRFCARAAAADGFRIC